MDRVVASVGPIAITQRDVEEEYHFEQFLQGRSPKGSPDSTTRKAVLNRLISQKLLAEQMSDATSLQKEAERTLNQVRKEFPSNATYHSALAAIGMTEPQVLKRLAIYQGTLRMIDDRLRSSARPDPNEVETYYKETFVPEYAKTHSTPPPPLAEVQDQVQEVLVQKKMNQLLDKWLERLKSTSRVVIHSN